MARLTRAETEAYERRRRNDVGRRPRRLNTAGVEIDEDYEYRWTNDERGKVQLRQEQSWDVVSSETREGDTGLGTGVAHVVDTTSAGQPVRGYLMRKRKEFVEIDRRLAEERRAEVEKQIKTLAPASADVKGPGYYNGITGQLSG